MLPSGRLQQPDEERGDECIDDYVYDIRHENAKNRNGGDNMSLVLSIIFAAMVGVMVGVGVNVQTGNRLSALAFGFAAFFISVSIDFQLGAIREAIEKKSGGGGKPTTKSG